MRGVDNLPRKQQIFLKQNIALQNEATKNCINNSNDKVIKHFHIYKLNELSLHLFTANM